MELHDILRSRLAEIKATLEMILYCDDSKYTANDICKLLKFWWIIYICARFGIQVFRGMVGIRIEQTVPHYWLS